MDLLFFNFYCFSYSFNHLLVYSQENERNEKAISFCCMGRRHFNNSPICSRLSKQESTEYYRISTAINNGKFDHILSDIDKLFPPDRDLNSIRQTNRFMLLRLYYEKTGDTKKEKQLLTETSKNSEIMNDDVTKGIVEERLKELK